MESYQKYSDGFRKLKAWQEAHTLVLLIYKITKKFPNEERFGMISQLRRAAASISANIAEGAGRTTKRDKSRFYVIARGSLTEVDNFLELAHDLELLSDEYYKKLLHQLNKTGYLLHRLILGNKT